MLLFGFVFSLSYVTGPCLSLSFVLGRVHPLPSPLTNGSPHQTRAGPAPRPRPTAICGAVVSLHLSENLIYLYSIHVILKQNLDL